MGQVITVDFAARKTSSHTNAADTPPASVGQPAVHAVAAPTAVSSIPTSPVPTPPVPMASAGKAVPAARMPRDTAETRQPNNLVEACAEMRVQADALAAAVENLRRASDDLKSLPRLARELCEAAV